MTNDICESEKMTSEMLSQAPQIMNAWSNSREGGKESALAVPSTKTEASAMHSAETQIFISIACTR